MLPTQPVFREYFDGSEENHLDALHDAIVKFTGLMSPTEKFRIYDSDEIKFEELASAPIVLEFLQSLILITKSKYVLEIGTFVGVSAMYMASVLAEGGRVVTIEKYGRFADIARRNVTQNKPNDKIKVIHGDALQEIKKLANTRLFDFIFLDGDKAQREKGF